MGFHVSRQCRERYQFDDSLFAPRGSVHFTSFHQARLFAQRLNQHRDLAQFPEQAVRAGQINAMGLIAEIQRQLVVWYQEQKNPSVIQQALAALEASQGSEAVDAALRRFVVEFPPVPVYRRELSPEEFLESASPGAGGASDIPHREMVLQEMLLLWLSNVNPAFSPFLELFDDAALERDTAYPQILRDFQGFFRGQPSPGREFFPSELAPSQEGYSLIEMLRGPARAAPHSLTGQLEYILERWAPLLSAFPIGRLLYRVLASLDFVREEEKPIFAGPGPALVYEFAGMEHEPEQFSPDDDWMPRLVLLAKNSYVWLDQLSRKYGRPIRRLDEIPEEELDLLARQGFSGLWLIGIWERSRGSRTIKQWCGNSDAVASAYSVYDYNVADDLGGEAACDVLRERAWKRGIRLASDMVPNHVGIDARWVIQHPDWFVSVEHSPFPTYSFTGHSLVEDDRVGIYLEDHYFNRTDAAVVFKRTDRWTGSEKFIYHGNDGTRMPWNDTAQLNYLIAEVREAVIQTILHVARQFPIIRFDAAMTLAKKHFQRLWFPQPGTGGAIPSRAEHGLTREQFDALMPHEFWREVVDRVAAEVPGTLLLAEAFWLMEGYFVRTLGMHRVYNSAFMNMLRDEENANYRSVIKNTIEFDPEVLRRYVNFMNNPDEETAIDQFGKDDKYFGVCAMMVTMPGLPMIGHGQIEGFHEKYGMEYRRALWEEYADPYLAARHEREIFPLLHLRRLFAGVDHFLLFDCYTADGSVNEDVFAYSNRLGEERSLFVYHNRFATAQGWLHTSAAYADKGHNDRPLIRKTLGEGLGLNGGEGAFCIFRDVIAGLEYIRSSRELRERGLFINLDAYKYQVLLDFREVQDTAEGDYALLAGALNGRGVPSILEARQEMLLRTILEPFQRLVNPDVFRRLEELCGTGLQPTSCGALLDEMDMDLAALLHEINETTGGDGDASSLAREIRQELEIARPLPPAPGHTADWAGCEEAFQYLREEAPLSPAAAPAGLAGATSDAAAEAAVETFPEGREAMTGRAVEPAMVPNPTTGPILVSWVLTHSLGKMVDPDGYAEQSRSWLDEWLLGKIIGAALRELGESEGSAHRSVALIKILTSHQQWFEESISEEDPDARARSVLESWLQDKEVLQFLQVNRHQGILWFNKESFEQLLWWMLRIAVLLLTFDPDCSAAEASAGIRGAYGVVKRLQEAEARSEYRLDRLRSSLGR